MSVFQGDFLGFTLGETHSSQLNITRVSSGDRYDDDLLPRFKDTTVEVPGGDGTYYWNTYYQQKPFTLNFAYDDLRDEDLRTLRQLFGYKGIRPLIFDELPYKKYMVKVAAPPQFKYICFDYQDMRLYKGEGSVQLVAYYPYALATRSSVLIDKNEAPINNVGDLPAQLKIYFAFNGNNITSFSISLRDLEDNLLGKLSFDSINQQENDAYIMIDSYTHLVEGLDEHFHKTGNLYNKYIKNGDFFDAPVGRTRITVNNDYEAETSFNFSKLEYTPLYY